MRKHHPFILFLAFVAPIFVAGFFASFQKHGELAAEVRRQKAELERLIEENEKFGQTIAYFSLKTNIEREIRSRLNLVRPGEVAVVLLSPRPSPTPSPDASKEPVPFYIGILKKLRFW